MALLHPLKVLISLSNNWNASCLQDTALGLQLLFLLGV